MSKDGAERWFAVVVDADIELAMNLLQKSDTPTLMNVLAMQASQRRSQT